MTATAQVALRFRRLPRWAARGAVAATALTALVVLALIVVIPFLTGGTAHSVRSGSMAPAIAEGALVLDRPVATRDLKVGDVVTYGLNTGDRRILVTHRIVAVDRTVSPPLLTMRGDANRSDDLSRVPADAVRGRVWLVIPWLGTLQQRALAVRWPLLAFLAVGASTYAFAGRAVRRRPEEESP